ncbi:MAG: hypothetical protein KAT58_11960, partial [candidate division Zixibacteria bacterium]|nr:hypothetical protein [candidate division Zixibacteria bacterium]
MIHDYTFKIDGGDPVTVQASGVIEAVGMLDPGLDWYMMTRSPVVESEVHALKARVAELEKASKGLADQMWSWYSSREDAGKPGWVEPQL